MYALTNAEKVQMKLIASFYGCKVKFTNYDGGGRWELDYIEVGPADTRNKIYTVFCHELAHFINWKTDKYPLYHTTLQHTTIMRRQSWTTEQYARYALRAELYTETIGKKICNEWFPKIQYKGWYKNRRYCKEFLFGYYL